MKQIHFRQDPRVDAVEIQLEQDENIIIELASQTGNFNKTM